MSNAIRFTVIGSNFSGGRAVICEPTTDESKARAAFASASSTGTVSLVAIGDLGERKILESR